MKYYVAGPMSNIPQFNFPAFFKAREELTKLGYEVILPADMDDPVSVAAAMASPEGKSGTGHMTWGQCLAKDVELVADHVEGIIFLPGWQMSRGARLEAFTGLLCDRKFMFYDPAMNYVACLSNDYVRDACHYHTVPKTKEAA